MAKLKAFNTGKFPEKVFAMASYDGAILQQTYEDPVNKTKINRGAAFLIRNYFDVYMDAKARGAPKAYHHVYEFDKTGDKQSRLFKSTIANAGDGSVTLTYSLTMASEPNRQGYEFPSKAIVMEQGDPVTILPKRKKYLKYRLENGEFITSKQSYVPQPGGPVAGNFQEVHNNFMRYRAHFVLKKFKFYETVERAIITKRRLVIPRINSGMVTDAVRRATIDAAQIAQGVNTSYV